MKSNEFATPGAERDSLSGVALVTGGGRGVGASIARVLSQAGMRVAVLARTGSEVSSVAHEIHGFPVVADVTIEAEVVAAVARVEAEVGPISLLVNSAGVGGNQQPAWNWKAASWWHVFEVNVLGVFLTTQAVIKGMLDRRNGRIVSLGSGASYSPPKGVSPLGACYGASKAALGRFMELLAAESATFGVSAFTISPGYIRSEMTREFPDDTAWADPDRVGQLVRVIASGRADALSGRYLHAQYDDIEDLISRAREIIASDLNAVRLRKSG
jgi:NAD(P)-dependent dehydrogenase (short-subunit alcohol dehydrogenase family)